jgi:hypothetical protein
MNIHKQKPCDLVGTPLCGNFKKFDLVTFNENKVSCRECKVLMKRCKK